MGGEWGIGASLVMESIPPKLRGPVSGLLQSGYPSGYFLASLVYFLLFDTIGWRGMFMVGVAPAILVFLIRMRVEESPAFVAHKAKPRINPLAELARPLEDRALPRRADDRVQLLQPRNAGSLSDLPPEAASLRHAYDRHAHRDHECRRDRRRDRFWHLVGKDRAQACNHHRQPAGLAGHSALEGVLDHAVAARARRVPGPDRGAGRTGYRPRSASTSCRRRWCAACFPASPTSSAI